MFSCFYAVLLIGCLFVIVLVIFNYRVYEVNLSRVQKRRGAFSLH